MLEDFIIYKRKYTATTNGVDVSGDMMGYAMAHHQPSIQKSVTYLATNK